MTITQRDRYKTLTAAAVLLVAAIAAVISYEHAVALALRYGLAGLIADSGTGLVYWYGYDEPGTQAEAHRQLAALTRAPLWCGELTVTGTSASLDALARATTPIGFGVILANLQESTAGACAALGNAFSDAYADAILPDGSPVSLAFTSSSS